MNPARFALLASVALSPINPANATDLVGTDGNRLFAVSTLSGSNTAVGGFFLLNTEHELGIPRVARGHNGSLYGISDSDVKAHLYSIDGAGNANLLFPLPGPATVEGVAVDPASGDIFFLDSHGLTGWAILNRLDPTTGTLSPIGNIGTTPNASFQGLGFDVGGSLFALQGSTNSLWAVDPSSPNNSSAIGSFDGGADFSGGGALAREIGTGVMYAYAQNDGQLWKVDTLNAAASAGAVVASPNLLGLASKPGAPCFGQSVKYGTGCSGTGGFTPQLSLSGCPDAGQAITLSLVDGLGGSSTIFFFGLAQGATPMGSGCILNVIPLLPVSVGLPLSDGSAGAGALSIFAFIPGPAAGLTITMQAFVIDGGTPTGFSNSNGLEITIS